MRVLLVIIAFCAASLFAADIRAGNCPDRARLLKAAVEFERAVNNFARLAVNGHFESRNSMYGSLEGKLDALLKDVRRVLLVARAQSGTIEDMVKLKQEDGANYARIMQDCGFPENDMMRLRQDFEILSIEMKLQLTQQRGSLKMSWRDVEKAYQNLDDKTGT